MAPLWRHYNTDLAHSGAYSVPPTRDTLADVRFLDADYPADPYPGRRPPASYVHDEGVGHRIEPPGEQWLAEWLAARGAAGVARRTAVLAYGSNACPAKLTWLREQCGLAGPVPVLLARCTGLAAVWATGRRAHDGVRPVVLAVAPGVREQHAVLLADDEQLRALDLCEGVDDDPPRYRREPLSFGAVTAEDGRPFAGLQYYRGARPDRMPLLVDGRPVRAGAAMIG